MKRSSSLPVTIIRRGKDVENRDPTDQAHDISRKILEKQEKERQVKILNFYKAQERLKNRNPLVKDVKDNSKEVANEKRTKLLEFMELERNQVKERNYMKKMKEERESEEILKDIKEDNIVEESHIVEDLHDLKIKEEEEMKKKTLEDEKIKQNSNETSIKRKNDETYRYIAALHSQIEDKLKMKGIEIDPFCLCDHGHIKSGKRQHLSFFISKFSFFYPKLMTLFLLYLFIIYLYIDLYIWEKCARNCVFYKNHHLYYKALQDVYEAVAML